MGLLTFPFSLPLRGVVKLAQVIQEEAEQTLCDPAVLRRHLEQIAQARASGELTEEEASRLEAEVLTRFTRSRESPGG